MSGLKLTPFTVAGRINSGAFQKSKAIATKCDAAASATIIELLPTDYAKLMTKLSEEFGGPAYLHESGVAVYSEQAGFIGDDAEFVKWLGKNNIGGVAAAANSDGTGTNWDAFAEAEFQALLCESERTFAFLELAIESDGVIGRLVFELFPEIAPVTCENFLALCEKESGGYAGSPIHRISSGDWLQGGDVVSGNGDGGATASGSVLADESYHLKHSEYGVLGMANTGKPHSATSQFYVTFAPTPFFDGSFVAFGKLVDGHKLLSFVEVMDVANQRPRANLHVSAAGKILPIAPGSFYADEEQASIKLQAMHRTRLAKKELAEKKAAAARVQAAKRGQKARKEAKEQREAAVKVQAISRGRKSRKERQAK